MFLFIPRHLCSVFDPEGPLGDVVDVLQRKGAAFQREVLPREDEVVYLNIERCRNLGSDRCQHLPSHIPGFAE